MGVKLGRSHFGRNLGRGFFENGVMRRIFGPRRYEVAEELNEMYSSPKNFPMIKKITLALDGYVARMVRPEVYTGFWWV